MTLAQDKALSTSMRCAKYMLLTISFMFGITAVLLVMVGSTIQAIYFDFRLFIDDRILAPPALLVAIGFILLAVAALGAYGAVRQSVMLINLYGVCLFLVFLLEVAAAITAFVMQGHIYGMLERTMDYAMREYEKDEYIQTSVDFMQYSIECCGVHSPADWRDNWSPNKNLTVAQQQDNEVVVPASCCGHFSDMNAMICDQQFEDGCYNRMTFLISQSVMLVATGATAVAFVQLLGVFSAFMLAKTLRRNKSLRDARRWQMQQSLDVLIAGGKMSSLHHVVAPDVGYTQLERANGYTNEYTAASPSVN